MSGVIPHLPICLYGVNRDKFKSTYKRLQTTLTELYNKYMCHVHVSIGLTLSEKLHYTTQNNKCSTLQIFREVTTYFLHVTCCWNSKFCKIYLSELRITEEITQNIFFVKQLWITKNNFNICYYILYLYKQVQEIKLELCRVDTDNFSRPFQLKYKSSYET